MLEAEVARGEHLLLADVGDKNGVVELPCHGIHNFTHAQVRAAALDCRLDDLLALDVVTYAEFVYPLRVVAFRDLLGDHGECTLHVAENGHVGIDEFVYLSWVDFEVYDLGVDAEIRRVARDAVVETHAYCYEKVAIAVLDVGGVVAVHAEHADILRMVRRQGREPEQRGRSGHAALLEEREQLLLGVPENHALTHQSHRPAGEVDQTCSLEYLVLVDLDLRLVAADEPYGLVFEVEHPDLCILRYVDHNRPRTSRRGYVEGLGQYFGYVGGALDLTVPLGDRLSDLDEVDLLECVRTEEFRSHLSAYEYDGGRVEHGVGESRHGVRGARARGDDADTRLAAGAGVSLRGVYGTLLVTNENMVYTVAVVVECIVYGDDGTSRIAEDGIYALGQKRPYESLRARYVWQRLRRALLGCLHIIVIET